jgi:hypothetical protein
MSVINRFCVFSLDYWPLGLESVSTNYNTLLYQNTSIVLSLLNEIKPKSIKLSTSFLKINLIISTWWCKLKNEIQKRFQKCFSKMSFFGLQSQNFLTKWHFRGCILQKIWAPLNLKAAKKVRRAALCPYLKLI